MLVRLLTYLPTYLLADSPALALDSRLSNLLSSVRPTRHDPLYPTIDPYPFTTRVYRLKTRRSVAPLRVRS
ncbi:uncharacterized protein C8Q71DRAFT_767520 [Rhodofomes roseus]|uniref:Secreted protein n=1 Tax=Rhodofomes roseus TaxID=34475 RepID=A0ABQ8KBK5_9APHY|nr:uncharacterized protein C8Q71DRAFT_767520 [Rhodofomes roseus]KAH9834930.1 hypothetical protein C8Q71DRAFT_767520 [Rhodofomes roseus]